MLIDFVAISNRCLRLANEFTYSLHMQTTADAIADIISRLFRYFTHRFHIHILRILQHFCIHGTILSTADSRQPPSSVRSLRLSSVCFASRGKAGTEKFTADVGQCCGGSIIWPRAIFSSLVLVYYMGVPTEGHTMHCTLYVHLSVYLFRIASTKFKFDANPKRHANFAIPFLKKLRGQRSRSPHLIKLRHEIHQSIGD